MNNNLGKRIYTEIITEFNNKNTTELLKLIQQFKKPVINSIIRQTLIKTQNFEYAIKLNDTSNSNDLKTILNEIFNTPFKRVDIYQLTELYEKSPLKKETIKNELFKKFKPLFASDLYHYKLIWFKYFNSTLINNLNGGSKYKQQSYSQIKFNLSILVLNQINIEYILKLLITNKVCIGNIYVTQSEFIITNNYSNFQKTFFDVELESLLLHKLNGKVTIKIIIDVYESCINENQNLNELKSRTKMLIKLLCN